MNIFKRLGKLEWEVNYLGDRVDVIGDRSRDAEVRLDEVKEVSETVKLLELQRDYTDCEGCKVHITKSKMSTFGLLMLYHNVTPYTVRWEKGKKDDGVDFKTIEDVEKFLKHDLETHVKAFLYDNKGGKK